MTSSTIVAEVGGNLATVWCFALAAITIINIAWATAWCHKH